MVFLSYKGEREWKVRKETSRRNENGRLEEERHDVGLVKKGYRIPAHM